MILGVYIIGFFVSIVGIVMKVKAAYVPCFLWLMDIILWILGKTIPHESLVEIIISIIWILLTLFWIIRVNKIMSEVK